MDASQESGFHIDADNLTTGSPSSPSFPNVPGRGDRKFLFDYYGDKLREKVERVFGVIKDSVLGVVLDEELVHTVGEVKPSENGDELFLEHYIIHPKEKQKVIDEDNPPSQDHLILPNTDFLGDETLSYGCPYRAFNVEAGELPFVIVSSLKLNNGLPEVQHKVKLTDSGYRKVIATFNSKHEEGDWFNIPNEGKFSHLNREIEVFLASLLKETIASESASNEGDNLGSMSDDEYVESRKLGSRRDRHKKSLPETNSDEYHFNTLSDYYKYYSIDGIKVIDRETMAINIQISIPKHSNVIDKDNLIYMHASRGSIDDYPDTEKQYIENLPLGMDFMRYIDWETTNIEVSLVDGYLDIKKAKPIS